MHSYLIHNHTPNFSTMCPAFPEIRKKGYARAHVQMYLTPDLSKMLSSWSLTTPLISAQSIPPFPRYKSGGTSAVGTCRCTPPMTCAMCIITWSVTAHQVRSQSSEPFLSYSLATYSHTLHAARATCQANPQMSPIQTQSICIELI